MCQKKPGPRCSPHTRKVMAWARSNYKESVEAYNNARASNAPYAVQEKALAKLNETEQTYVVAQLDFYASPRGRELIQARVSSDATPKADRFYRASHYLHRAQKTSLAEVKKYETENPSDERKQNLKEYANALDERNHAYAVMYASDREDPHFYRYSDAALQADNKVMEAKGRLDEIVPDPQPLGQRGENRGNHYV